MKMKKMFATTLAVAMSVSALAGCSKSADETTAAATAAATTAAAAEATTAAAEPSAEPVTLRFSWWGGDTRHEATLKAIELFESKYPHITIEAEYGSNDGYNEKKLTEFASGTAPDIFQLDNDFFREYYNRGVLANLSELDIDFSEFDSNYLRVCSQLDGDDYWGIPTGISGSAIIVNKDLADKVGVDLSQPYSWTDLIEMGKKVREYDPDCYLLSATNHAGIQFFIRAYCRQLTGKPMISLDYELNTSEEQFVDCFTMIKSLYDNEVLAPVSYKASFNEDVEDPKWNNGKYVGSVGWVSSAVPLQDAGPEGTTYYSAQLPLKEDRVNDGWFTDRTNTMAIYANSEHKEEAALFLDFFFNDPEALEILGTVRSVPPTAKGQEIAVNCNKLDPLSAQSAEVSLQYAGDADQGPSTTSEAAAIYTEAFEAIAYGAMTPEEAAKDIVEKLTDYCEANRP